jgi:prepilin-type N-terminal cleavage/methylation domain-containing protein
MKRTRRSGFSLIEVVIATAILGAVIAMVFMLLISASTQEVNQTTAVQLDTQLRETLNRIAEDIRLSGPTPWVLTDPSTGAPANLIYVSPSVHDTFQPSPAPPQRVYAVSFSWWSGFAATAQFNNSVRYYWRSAPGETRNNGVDDNRDGYIDDGEVVREVTTPGGTVASVICRNVTNRGLAFELLSGANPPRSVTVSLEVQGHDIKGRLITRQSVTSVGPRN